MNIVLVHGILGFSHLDVPLSQIEYFSGVAEFLRERFQAAVIVERERGTVLTKIDSFAMGFAMGIGFTKS
jgi:hypothetical protein